MGEKERVRRFISAVNAPGDSARKAK